MNIWFAAFIAYCIGSIPFGYIVARLKGVNIREEGTGNIGATNVSRVLGKRVGLCTLFFDIGKGVLATVLLPELTVHSTPVTLIACLFGMLAVLGHCFSVFIKFGGGKGVATALGVFVVLAPWATLAAFAAFIITLKLSRYVSLSSISAAVTLCVFTLATCPELHEPEIAITAIIVSSLVILRHKSNISRLLNKTEPKYKAAQTEPDS